MKFYITATERSLIVSTPSKECWICDLFSNSFEKDKKGYFLSEKIFEDWAIEEHLEQIIKREIAFEK